MPNNHLVIYHAHCPDGFGAAWVATRALEQDGSSVELYEGVYGEDPPYELARGRKVYVVDFSYPRAKMLALHEVAGRLTVLDHHKTAQADCIRLDFCLFDMNRSGAGLTWDYFHPGVPRPWIVDYVEDRDLWRFKLPNSEAISLRIRLTPHELAAWDALARTPLEEVEQAGAGALTYLHHYVRDACRQIYTLENADGTGVDIACVNVSYTGVSDVLHGVLTISGKDIALAWHRREDGGLGCSLRSVKGVDCSVFAKRFGGGGHAQAAGFRLEKGHPFIATLVGI